MNTPDRDLTEEEIKQACRHYCALNNLDPDVTLGYAMEPYWKAFIGIVTGQHNLLRVLQKVYQDAERRGQ